MPDRVYLNVISDFDTTGYLRPRYITWKDGRIFRIDEIRDYRPASIYRNGMKGACYTVVILGKTRRLFLEKTDDRETGRIGRWFVEQ